MNSESNGVIGLQIYTLREFWKTKEGLLDTIEKISKIGYRVIQASGNELINPKEFKKIIDNNGIRVCSTHTGYEQIINEVDRVIEGHKILGCEAIICPGLPLELHNKEGYLKAAKDFEKVLPEIKKNGLVLGYHNHAIEFEKYDGKTGLEILLENCSLLEAEIDTYWVQYGGGDPGYWIDKYSGRITNVHFKDMGNIQKKQVMPPIGTGNLNWVRIIESCKKAKVKYWIVEMDNTTIEPFEAVRISFENMKKM